jgi:hypothetical protein
LNAGKPINFGTSPCYCTETTYEATEGSNICPQPPDGGYCTDGELNCWGEDQCKGSVTSPGGGETPVKLTISNINYCCEANSVEDCCTDEGDYSHIDNIWTGYSLSDYITKNSISDQFFQAYQASSFSGSYGPYLLNSVRNSCNIASFDRGFGLSASIRKNWSNERPTLTNGQLAPFSSSATAYDYEISPKVKSKLLVNGPIENCYVKVWVALIKTVTIYPGTFQEATSRVMSIESITPYVINSSPTNNSGCSSAILDCSTNTSDTDQSNLFTDSGVEFELDPSTFEIVDLSNTLSDTVGSASYSVGKEYRIIKYSLDPNWEPPHRVTSCTKNNYTTLRIFPVDEHQTVRSKIDEFSRPVTQSVIDEYNSKIDAYMDSLNCN